MKGVFYLSLQARRDVEEIEEYLATASLDAAIRFQGCMWETLGRLAESPLIGRERQSRSSVTAGVRMWTVDGFRSILVFYRPVAHGIWVLRVLHGARDLETELDSSQHWPTC